MGVIGGGFAGWQLYSASADDTSQGSWFAGYVDVTATPTFAFETPTTKAAKQVVLSFIVASRMAPARRAGATHTRSTRHPRRSTSTAGSRGCSSRVATSRSPSAGSRTRSSRVTCTSVTQLAAAYASVIDRYNLSTIDLDVEGTALDNSAANTRRAEALAIVQKQRRAEGKSLAVWLTLPVTQTGLAVNGQDAVRATLAGKVDLAGVNAMTMDYGSSLTAGTSMVQASEDAVVAVQRQLGILYKQQHITLDSGTLWSKVGATPMIGQNDDKGEVFSLADATKFNAS